VKFQFQAQFLGGLNVQFTYPNTFLARPLTNQPRLIYAPNDSFVPEYYLSGVPEAYFSKNLNELSVFDPPLECHSFSVKWRTVLYRFLAPTSLSIIESREMLTGAEVIYRLLSNLNLKEALDNALDKWLFFSKQRQDNEHNILEFYEHFRKSEQGVQKIKLLGATLQSQKNAIIKRISLLKTLSLAKSHPAWTILFNLPVLPPDLRPIMKLKDGQIILSDLNELYRMILTRNLAISQLSIHSLTAMVQKVLLQRAVDALLGNGLGNTLKDLDNHPYKSIADILTGKEGRFRENLLGKRVDYSGRSVIVVGPALKLYQCGLPREMAIDLFQPFIMRSLISHKLARNLRAAKIMILKRNPIIWKILKKVVKNHYIILNRAPTLHRLGIQAFQPILVKERALHLHPLVCSGFNADFDGDQMAVHVPLSLEAQAEAYMLMSPYFNLLSPATGDAITLPSQDMLLGLYTLTLETKTGIYKYYDKKSDNIILYNERKNRILKNSTGIFSISDRKHQTDTRIWLSSTSSMKIANNSTKEMPIEIQYDFKGNSCHIYEHAKVCLDYKTNITSKYIRTTLGRILLNQQIEQAIQGTEYVYRKLLHK
jgi:DNA-directed RNA polymerase beta' subunit